MRMIDTVISPEAARELAEIGRFAADRGWVPATSGNFSRRLDAQTIAITRSGADKGALTPADFIAVALDEPLPAGVSAETPLHVARYRADGRIGAVLHIHSVAATVLSRADESAGDVELEGFEMHKALEGVTTHEGTLRIPIFANAQDTHALAKVVEARLGANCTVPAYLLAGHGLYVWGATMADARRHVEGIEFLLRCALEERRIR
jgi:methylthioribulose-1-phosphate dehydratase